MIRIGLPVPTLLRLRIRAQVGSRRLVRNVKEARNDALLSASNGLARINPLSWISRRRARIPTGPNPRTNLNHFEENFQHLIDLLCWSAKEGVKADGVRRYAELRVWFLQNYDSIRPALQPYLASEHGDTVPHEDGAQAPRDAFESLFLPQNLDALINSDTIISRIQRTRFALDTYRDGLEPVTVQ